MVCRTRRPREDLIRFARDPQGELVPDLGATLPGRGGWACPTPACLGSLCGKPRVLGRALKDDRGAWPAPEVLRRRVRGAIDEDVLRLVPRCAASGLVNSGARGVREAAGPVLALLCAADASALARTQAQAAWPDALLVSVALDRSALGALIHKGPRAVLAVRAGTPGDQLALRLRWRQALG